MERYGTFIAIGPYYRIGIQIAFRPFLPVPMDNDIGWLSNAREYLASLCQRDP